MFRKTPLAWLCAALFASSASYAATPTAAPAEPVPGADHGSETRADTRLMVMPVMPVMGINDEDFPIEPVAAGDGDLWERIRKGFSIPEMSSPLVSNHTATYAARPEAFERLRKRASRYLFYVVQELEKRGMPTELALLPVIESGFNPNAYSHAKAAGMWQFIPSTGLRYNLKQNAFRDERRDVVASTNAAFNYLQQLHTMFGDCSLHWPPTTGVRVLSARRLTAHVQRARALITSACRLTCQRKPVTTTPSCKR